MKFLLCLSASLFMFSPLLLGCSRSEELSPPATPVESASPASSATAPQGQELPITAQAEIGSQMIQLEVAQTPQQQATGLMYRPTLADDRGMLFSFDPPRPVSFWMKNVEFPLDMVFIRDGEVRAIAAEAPPCRSEPCPVYGPNEPVDQVIELRGGRAAELGLQVGDPLIVQPLAEL